jgi:hypothetical protein
MVWPRPPFRAPGLFRLCLLGFERRVLHLGGRSIIDGHDLPGRRHVDVDLGPRDRLQGPSVPVAHLQPLPEHREGTTVAEPSFVSDGKVEIDLLRRRPPSPALPGVAVDECRGAFGGVPSLELVHVLFRAAEPRGGLPGRKSAFHGLLDHPLDVSRTQVFHICPSATILRRAGLGGNK